MKRIYIILSVALFMLNMNQLRAQGVGINTPNPDPSSLLELQSNQKGLLIPRMTTAERDAISNPAQFLMVVNTETECINMYAGSAWKQLCPSCIQLPPAVGSNSPVCDGATLSLTASTVSGATYNWTGPNGFVSTDQNPSVANFSVADSGAYVVTATVNGCTSVPVVAQVGYVAPTASPVAGGNSPLCAGDDLNLTASAISGATYSWTGPNGFSSGIQNPTVSNIQLSGAGDYVVTATVNGCASLPDTVSIVVNGGGGSSMAFDYTGVNQTWTVPACVTSVDLKVWGAGGAGSDCPYAYYGGAGAYASATLSVSPGDVLTLLVGQGGVAGGSTITFGGGGSGDGVRGSGGGRSAVIKSGVEVLIAGGGGAAGCSGGGSPPDLRGGGGGYPAGQDGLGTNSGKGGTQSAGGAGGTCSNSNPGTPYQGGSNYNGGGGGYYGGGSGADCGPYSPGAGGGSSFLHGSLSNTSTLNANYETPGNNGDADRNGAATGGAVNANGGNGRIVIYW